MFTNSLRSLSEDQTAHTRVIAEEKVWIEGEALRQLDLVSKFKGMVACVGMPDLHPGKGYPIGAAFLSRDWVYPSLVGSDIGCGMHLTQTSLSSSKLRLKAWIEQMNGLDQPWEGDPSFYLAKNNMISTQWDHSLGETARGNHFCELQMIDTVQNLNLFEKLNLDENKLFLLVHTGSRGLGQEIYTNHAKQWGDSPLESKGSDALEYMISHDHAVRWAKINREICAQRAMSALDTDGHEVLDICHNSVTNVEYDNKQYLLHRKGAAPVDQGPVMIPGSRGSLSYLVQPLAGNLDSLWSIAHGAGRKIARHEAKGKLRDLYTRDRIKENPFGGRVICGMDSMIWEEAPECYKDIRTVIDSLEKAGLIETIATFKPLVTFKTSESCKDYGDQKQMWKKDRKRARGEKWERQKLWL